MAATGIQICIFFFFSLSSNVTHAFAQITTDGDEWVNGYIFSLLYALLPSSMPSFQFLFLYLLLPPQNLYFRLQNKWSLAYGSRGGIATIICACVCVSCETCGWVIRFRFVSKTRSHTHTPSSRYRGCVYVCVYMSPCDIWSIVFYYAHRNSQLLITYDCRIAQILCSIIRTHLNTRSNTHEYTASYILLKHTKNFIRKT